MQRSFLSYSGPITFTIKRELILALRQRIAGICRDVQTRKRVSYVFEELVTNVHEYYKKNMPEEELFGVSLSLKDELRIEMEISNTIRISDTESVLKNVELINTVKPEALKEKFQEGLQRSDDMQSGTGLGLISMRMRTGLSYSMKISPKNDSENIIHFNTSILLPV